MRHTLIASVCVVIVLLYSAFTYFYISDFIDEIEDELYFSQQETYSEDNIEDIKETFEDRKNMLMFLLNKEHLENIEEYIIKLEQAFKYNNQQDIQTCRNLLNASIEDVKHHNKCII